jgi:hypothetical protein
MNTKRFLSLLPALALLVVACSGGTTTASQGSPSQGVTESGVPAILDFSAPALSGGTIDGADYSGKAVALWFWAPW